MSSTEQPSVEVPSSAEEKRALVQQGYDACAARYLAWQSGRKMPKVLEYLSKLFAQLKPNASVLELGCGPGVPFTQLLANHELELQVTAVDISASQIALAREKLSGSSRVEFVHTDMTKLDYPEGKFDAVVGFYSWFHIPKEEQRVMVTRITNWLKPGGVLLLNTSNEEGDVLMSNWMGVKMFMNGFGVEGTLKIFKEFGKGLDVTDEVAGEMVGSQEVFFHLSKNLSPTLRV